MDYQAMMLRALGLVPVCILLVEAFKRQGLSGIWLPRVSFVTGLLLGVLTEAALTYQPSFSWWVSSVIYGLLVGVGASGSYDLARGFKPQPDQSGKVAGE